MYCLIEIVIKKRVSKPDIFCIFAKNLQVRGLNPAYCEYVYYGMTLKVSHIAKSYGEHKVLADASLEALGGRVSVLMGTNGSGKTTLFNIISGYTQQDSGEILLDGVEMTKHKPYLRKRLGIGRTFQDMRLIGNLTVNENVMLAFPEQKGEKWWKVLFPNMSVQKEQEGNTHFADEILAKCFIQDIADSKANEISYGQQKLLNLACCIASGASVLLLDEPVAGVNPVFRKKLLDIIRDLKAQGKALLIIEHNADFIEEIADEILFLHDGQLQRYNSYQDFKDAPEVLDAYV